MPPQKTSLREDIHSTQAAMEPPPPQKKQRQQQQQQKTTKEDADGEDVPEPVQTVTKEMMAETTYEVRDGTATRALPLLI